MRPSNSSSSCPTPKGDLVELVLLPVLRYQIIQRGEPSLGSPLDQQLVIDMNDVVMGEGDLPDMLKVA